MSVETLLEIVHMAAMQNIFSNEQTPRLEIRHAALASGRLPHNTIKL
jgi:hypothetical protein